MWWLNNRAGHTVNKARPDEMNPTPLIEHKRTETTGKSR